jgi:hypothetical protein
MPTTTTTLVPVLAATVALLVFAPCAGAADALVIAAPGAKNLAAGEGWRAWAAPTARGRWQLVIRAPDGTIQAANIKSFGVPPDASISETSFAGPDRRVVAVYSRCRGASATKGCDIFQYDLAAGSERKLTRISTRAGSETAPSTFMASYAFARRGGPRPGTYTASRRHVRRVDSRVARETAVTHSRVAYRVGDAIIMSQLAGHRRRTIATGRGIFSVVLTRYRVGWLERAGHRTLAFMTDRIKRRDSVTVRRGTHDLPASTQSAVTDSSRITEYLDATGVKRAEPPLFR